MQRAARIVSFIFHPLLFPTYIFLALLNSHAYFAYRVPAAMQWVLTAAIFIVTFVFPSLSSYIMLKRGVVHSLEMENRSERIFPYLITAIYFFGCYFMLKNSHLSAFFYQVQLGAAITVLMAAIINLRWKISAHMAGIGGLAGVFFTLSIILPDSFMREFLLSVLLAGIIGAARLLAGLHSNAQIYAGFVLGFLCEWVVLTYFF